MEKPKFATWLCSILVLFVSTGAWTARGADTETNLTAIAKAKFAEARSRFQAETNNAEAAWHFGRACFDLGDLATNNASKAELAEQGIAACRQGIARSTSSAPAHYYLGMCIGQLADTKRSLAALRMVKEMEREFKVAMELDEHLDYAGPDRNLGLLYGEAPTVVSIGNRSKARQHLRRAVERAPDYPENRLNLIEACLKWGDTKDAQHELKALEGSLPDARKKLSGQNWAVSWVDWEKRLSAAKQKIDAR